MQEFMDFLECDDVMDFVDFVEQDDVKCLVFKCSECGSIALIKQD